MKKHKNLLIPLGILLVALSLVIVFSVNDTSAEAENQAFLLSKLHSSPVMYFQYVSIDNPDEWFIVKMNNRETIKKALEDLNGPKQLIVSGIIKAGHGRFNFPWSWHIDPKTVELAETYIELCDARPTHIEENLEKWLGKRWCPWGAQINQAFRTPPGLPKKMGIF